MKPKRILKAMLAAMYLAAVAAAVYTGYSHPELITGQQMHRHPAATITTNVTITYRLYVNDRLAAAGVDPPTVHLARLLMLSVLPELYGANGAKKASPYSPVTMDGSSLPVSDYSVIPVKAYLAIITGDETLSPQSYAISNALYLENTVFSASTSPGSAQMTMTAAYTLPENTTIHGFAVILRYIKYRDTPTADILATYTVLDTPIEARANDTVRVELTVAISQDPPATQNAVELIKAVISGGAATPSITKIDGTVVTDVDAPISGRRNTYPYYSTYSKPFIDTDGDWYDFDVWVNLDDAQFFENVGGGVVCEAAVVRWSVYGDTYSARGVGFLRDVNTADNDFVTLYVPFNATVTGEAIGATVELRLCIG